MTRLEEIKKRLDAATPGPWKNGAEPNHKAPWLLENLVRYPSNDGPGLKSGVSDFFQVRNKSDAEFIAHSPEDVKWLVDQMNKLECSLAFNKGLVAGYQSRIKSVHKMTED